MTRVAIFLITLLGFIGISCANSIFTEPIIEKPLTLVVFDSEVKSISFEYPSNWIAGDTPQGNHGDPEVIAYLRPRVRDYPYAQIIFNSQVKSSLEEVRDWGMSRFEQQLTSTTSVERLLANGEKALQKTYLYKDWSNTMIKCYHTYVLGNDGGYIFEFCIDEKTDSPELYSVWEQMVDSIVLKN